MPRISKSFALLLAVGAAELVECSSGGRAPGADCILASECESYVCEIPPGECGCIRAEYLGSCEVDEDCCSGACEGGECACGAPGTQCVSGASCCGESDCVNYECCAPRGESCADTECCSGACRDGTCGCGEARAFCTAPGDCCEGTVCGPANECCKELGQPCATDAECCGPDVDEFASCVEGTCQPAACGGPGTPCDGGSDCCSEICLIQAICF